MDNKAKETRQEIFKHSAAIHIENNITFVQRRAFNALLFHAYNELETAEEHRIPIQRLADLIGYDSHDMDYLKEASKAMMRCIVEWNVLEKDQQGPKWGATALLAQASIERGMFTYAYSPELRRRLHNPAMYARLDLNLQRRFKSKYGLALWELCADYLGSGREYGETPYIPLESFRKLLGTDNTYPTFKRLKDRVLNPAVDEINEVSDFRVVMDLQYKGRKVTALKFKIRRVALLVEARHEQKTLFPDLDDMPVVVKELKDVGISTQDALEIWQQGFGYVNEKKRPEQVGEDPEAAFAEYVHEKIHLLKRHQANSRIGNTTGFLLKAIKENYANPEFAETRKRQAVMEQKKTRQQRQREIKPFERRIAELEKARLADIRQRCKVLVQESPELLAPVVELLLAENATFQKIYKSNMTPADNYLHTPGAWSFIDPILEQRYPDHFAEIYTTYDPDLAEVKARLVELEQV